MCSLCSFILYFFNFVVPGKNDTKLHKLHKWRNYVVFGKGEKSAFSVYLNPYCLSDYNLG